MNRRILAVIPARGGSKGVPSKNIRRLAGKPLIAYTIEEALKSKILDRVIVSTEDKEIAEIAKRYGAEVPFMRPKELADDTAPTLPVIQHAVKFIEIEEKTKYDYVVVLQPTAPLRLSEDIDNAVQNSINTGADAVISVCKVEDMHPARMKKIVHDKLVPFCIEEQEGMRRQDLQPAYIRNGGIYIIKRDILIGKNTLLSAKGARPYIMPKDRSVSIDTELDFKLAEILLKDRGDRSPKVEKNSVQLFWKSCYGNEKLILGFPQKWNVKVMPMKDALTTSDGEMREKILKPIGSSRLRDLAIGKRKVAVAIDDLDRPTETYRILPFVIDELISGGVKKDDIYIIVSLGSHRPLTRIDLIKKVGEGIVKTIKIYNHNPYENLKYLGRTSWGTPLYINQFFMEADLRIGVGMLSPHPYAGFSGGGKIVLPGLAGMDTMELNHKPANAALSGEIGRVEENTRRAEIDEAAKIAGLDFIVNTVCNSEGKSGGVFAGEPTKAFVEAVKYAKKVYETNVVYNLDIGVFNAFPKDTHMLLAMNALNVWSTRDPDKEIVRNGGVIVIVSACSEGAGYHGLGDKGMRMYIRKDKHGSFKQLLKGRKIIFFSPNLINADIYDHYPRNVLLCNEWWEVINELKKDFGKGTSAGVFPCAALQMDKNLRGG